MATYPIKMLRDEDRQPFIPFTNMAAVVDSNGVTLQELMDNGKYKIQNNVTTSQAGKGVLDAYQGKVLNDKFNNYVPLSQKGVANGVATLDGDAKVPTAQLPSYVDDVIEAYIRSGATALSSTWLSLTDGGAALTPEKGKIYIIMSSGSYQNKQYRWSGNTYVLCNPSDVNSVNGFTGVVVLKELTIQKNGTQVGDKFNGSADKTVNITVPTKTSDITNDSGFITAADDITGNAATATKLQTARTINGTSFDGSANITTANWGTSRNIGIINSDGTGTAVTVAVNGSQAVNLKLPAAIKANITGNLTGNADTATKATQDGAGDVITDKYVKKAGDTMTGELKYNDTTGSTFIHIGSNNKDTTLMRVYSSDQTDTGLAAYGFSLKYIGTGTGNTNYLNLYTDNSTASTQVKAVQIAQDGTITVAKTISGTIDKANKDGSGNNIVNTYSTKANTISGLSVSGKVITYTKADGTTGTITTQDTIYTLPVAGTGINGTLGGIKVGSGLTIDSTTGVLSATGGGTADSVEWSGVLNKPTDISYWNNDSGYITLANVMAGATASTAGAAGVVPKPNSGDQAKYLRGDGQWATPTGNTYTAGTGIDITNYVVKNMGVTDVAASPSAAGNGTIAVTKGTASGTSTSYVSVKGLNDAAYKPVVTTIDTSASLPTSNAVKTFVEGKGYVTTNTTYTLSADTTNNKITLTPSSGTAQSITVPYATNAGTATATSGTLTIQKNGTNVATFNGSTATANILVPVVYTGTSTPSASTGVNGDIYIQTT